MRLIPANWGATTSAARWSPPPWSWTTAVAPGSAASIIARYSSTPGMARRIASRRRTAPRLSAGLGPRGEPRRQLGEPPLGLGPRLVREQQRQRARAQLLLDCGEQARGQGRGARRRVLLRPAGPI